jgi:phage replication O-like protein O
MASPQKENGYTEIAHEILEVMGTTNFNGTQFRILIFVLRHTYGFHRKCHEFSLKFIADGTKCNKQQVKRELDKLIDMKVVIVYKSSGFTDARILGLNKDYDKWVIVEKQKSTVSVLDDSKLISVQSANQSTVSELANEEYANQRTGGVSELAYQEIYSFKDIKDSTTTDPQMILMDEYCKLHQKLDVYLSAKERAAMKDLAETQIPISFILDTMNKLHKQKVESGEKVTSFFYYPNPIKDAWKRKNTVVTMPVNKYQSRYEREQEILKKFLEEGEHEQSAGHSTA